MKITIITFTPDGTGHCLWTEVLPLAELGRLETERAGSVQFNAEIQQWEVRLISDPEKVVFSHSSREECLNWETNTLNEQLLVGGCNGY